MASLEQLSIATADGFALQLSSDVANELARRIAGAANALPKRGLEVCGLLLGEHSAKGFVVTSLIPISCRYAEGPAFRASGEELSHALQGLPPLSSVVGFYRSRNDGSLDLDNQDRRLLELLAGRPLLALVVRQQKMSAGEGRLLVWDGSSAVESVGEIFSTGQWLTTVRPQSKNMKPVSTLGAQGVTRPPTAFETSSHPGPERPLEQTGTNQKWGEARLAWIAAAALAFVVLLLVGWQVDYTLPAGKRALPKEVRADTPPRVIIPGQGQLLAGAASKDLTPGLGEKAKVLRSLKLWIRDGDDIVLRELAVRELERRGKEDPETLPLLLETAQSDSSEVVRVAAVESIARGWKMSSSTRDLFEDRVRLDESLAVRQTTARILANARSPGEVANEGRAAVSEDKHLSPAGVSRPVVKTSQRDQAEAGIVAESKKLQAAPRARPSAVASPVPQTGRLPPPVPIEVAKRKPDSAPVHVSLPDIPSPPAPRLPVLVSEVISSPTVLRQTPAVAIPPDFRRLIRKDTLISVRIAIDAKGLVSKIYPSESKDNSDRLLWVFCSQAVRLWAFTPARRKNEAIAGETTVQFRFNARVGR